MLEEEQRRTGERYEKERRMGRGNIHIVCDAEIDNFIFT